jgi:cytochrome c oxidase subunit 2
MTGVPFLPASASTAAGPFDILAVSLLAIALAVLGLVVLLLLTFCVRYRKSRPQANRNLSDKKSWVWEISWTTASFVIFLGLYAWGADLYLSEHRPPAGARDIYIVGKQWMWKAEHPDGQREINTLHVPVGRPIRLVMTSEDVIHGFFVPAFRLKQDVVPGRYVTLWFTATRPGTYRLFCSQFCGVEHAEMDGLVTVMSDGDFQTWLAANALSGTLAAEGGALFRSLGCSGCHEPRASVKAPRLAGLFGQRVPLRGGGVAIADEDFIRNAILQPAGNPPAGYQATMPSFAGQVDEEKIVALVAYIKSLAAPGGTP